MIGPRRIAHTSVARVGALAAAVLLTAGLLTGCVSDSTHATADWLKGRPGVLEVTASGAYSGQQYSGVDRVELDPKASDKTITTLIADTIKQVTAHEDERVAVEFGRDHVDFTVIDETVASKAAALAGFSLWKQLRAVKKFSSLGIVTAKVVPGSVTVRTLRKPALEIYRALDTLPADLQIATYANTDDLTGKTPGAAIPAVDVVAGQLCTATPPVLDFAETILKDDAVSSGTLDLCMGFDVGYDKGTLIGAYAAPLRRKLDAATLAQFPVAISAPADGSPDGSDVHRAVVTPGAAPALGVIPYLEAAGAPAYSFSLDADRHLVISSISSKAPSTQVLGLLAAAPTAPQLPLISLDDGRVGASGTLGSLKQLLGFADGLQTTSKQFEDVELATATGTIRLADTGSLKDVPDFTDAATALVASNLWQTRDLTIAYQGVDARIKFGAVQHFEKSKLHNYDKVLQAFLDAFERAHH